MWRRGQIEIRALRTEASGYERQPGRVLLPTRSIEKIELCLRMDSWLEARKAFHESLH